METLIVHPETPEKAVMKALNVAYEEDIDTTEYLQSTKANKEALEQSIEQAGKGETTTITLDDVQKQFFRKGQWRNQCIGKTGEITILKK